jgi:NADP-dependent 3-hydroxy acid dehydrogenase YdfG
MSTLVIVGAGPGLGQAIARRFATEGFDVALVARTQEKLDRLAAELRALGVRAEGFAADITDRTELTEALGRVQAGLGEIDVLEFSPASAQSPELAAVDAIEVAVESLAPQIEYYLYGGVTTVQQVLPGMLKRGSGTILVTTGASSGPMTFPAFGNIAAGSGALRNWVPNLHAALKPRGIYAAHIALAAWIGGGVPEAEPDVIAEQYWQLYRARQVPELYYQAMG